MHSVQRSAEPRHLAQVRRSNTKWDDLKPSDRGRIRRDLSRDFSGICAYCETKCDELETAANSVNVETIDHFRPRSRFPDQSLEWLNLVYSCKRCNRVKGNKWPASDDLTSSLLPALYGRFQPVSEYVSPNADKGKHSTEDIFDFNVDAGEIVPSDGIGVLEYSMAARAIWDMDLNDERTNLGSYDSRNLCNRRKLQLEMLIERLKPLDDSARVWLAREFTLPDRPFSSFVNAYFRRTYPEFDQLFHR